MVRGQVSAVLCALVLATCLGGCAREEQRMNPENVLELRLGGNFESLAARLRRPPPGTARRIETADPTRPQPVAPPRQPEITLLEPDPKPVVGPEPQALTTPPQFHVVALQPGQTLYGICKAELGSGSRWQEVAKLNGWSAAHAEHLPAGQKVKLPVR